MPFGEVFSIIGFQIDSTDKDSLIEGEYISKYTFLAYNVINIYYFLFLREYFFLS